MIEYDLSETSLAQSDSIVRVPTEGELLAVTVGLLMQRERTFEDLDDGELKLEDEDLDTVARIIEQYVWPWSRELGAGIQLRARLMELVGLRIRGSCAA